MKTALLLLAPCPLVCSAGAYAAPTPLSIEQAIGLAMEHDLNIDRSDRSLALSRMQVADARSAYLPTASVTLSASQSASGGIAQANGFSYRRGISGSFFGSLTGSVSLPVDISGSIGRRVKGARMAYELAELSNDSVKRDAFVNVQIAYLNALQAQRATKIDESIIASLEALKKQAQKRLPSILPYLDVEIAGARESIRNSKAGEEQALDGLRLALQLPLDMDLDLTDEVPDPDKLPPVEVTERDVDSTMAVQTAERRLAMSQLSLEQAKDFRRPSLSVGASASQSLSGKFIDDAGESRSRDYSLNVALNIPVLNYDAGRSANGVKASELMLEQAEVDLRQARTAAQLSLRQARMNLARARERLKQLPDEKAAAQSSVNATRALFQVPAETAPALLAQVTNARQTWRSALLAQIDAKVDVAVATLRLANAIGKPVRVDRPRKASGAKVQMERYVPNAALEEKGPPFETTGLLSSARSRGT